jgi:hypothetical protein
MISRKGKENEKGASKVSTASVKKTYKNSNTNAKTITNSDSVTTYGLIINLKQVRNHTWREKLEKECTVTKNNSQAVFVNARSFNYFELLAWLHVNFEMSVSNVLALNPKIYPNKATKVDVDLTEIKYFSNNSCTFVCKVNNARLSFDQINKQYPLYNVDNAKYITAITDKNKNIESVVIEFVTSKVNRDNSQTNTVIGINSTVTKSIGEETTHQSNVRKAFLKNNFSGLLQNTGYIVPAAVEDNDLIFVLDNGESLKQLKTNGMSKMPFATVTLTQISKNITSDMFDYITIEDYYYSLQTNISK